MAVKLKQVDQTSLNKGPRLFAALGECLARFSWSGYLLAALVVIVSVIVVYRDFKQISLTEAPGYFIGISAWFWLSLGLVKFSKSYAQSIKEGNRNAILSFGFLAAVFAILAGLTAQYGNSANTIVFVLALAVLTIALLTILLLVFGLIYYRNELTGELSIYD